MPALIGIVTESRRRVPNAPIIGTATNVPSGRAYNNGRADVTFTAPSYTGVPALTSYTVTSSPGGYTATGTSSPISVTGLQSNTAYTFTVVANNLKGSSASSATSNSITATTVPEAPTVGTLTRTSDTVASLAFTAGNTGGSTITSYVSTASPTLSVTVNAGTTSPRTITGSFVGGTSYTLQIAAVNANGTSAYSSASNSVMVNPNGIGMTGPGGGIIFYDAGSTQSWGRYLEASTVNQGSGNKWSSTLYNVSTSTAIGTGMANTLAIIAAGASGANAAPTCRAYTGGGLTDWFLPSKDELNQLYVQRAYFTFLGINYWSSSQVDTNNTYAQVPGTGAVNTYIKTSSLAVRAIRAY